MTELRPPEAERVIDYNPNLRINDPQAPQRIQDLYDSLASALTYLDSLEESNLERILQGEESDPLVESHKTTLQNFFIAAEAHLKVHVENLVREYVEQQGYEMPEEEQLVSIRCPSHSHEGYPIIAKTVIKEDEDFGDAWIDENNLVFVGPSGVDTLNGEVYCLDCSSSTSQTTERIQFGSRYVIKDNQGNVEGIVYLRLKIKSVDMKLASLFFNKDIDEQYRVSTFRDLMGIKVVTEDGSDLETYMMNNSELKFDPEKDYRGTPRKSGYSSIHGEGKVNECPLEVQLVTPKDEERDQNGSSAHFSYKEEQTHAVEAAARLYDGGRTLEMIKHLTNVDSIAPCRVAGIEEKPVYRSQKVYIKPTCEAQPHI